MSKRSVLLQLAAHPTRYQIVQNLNTVSNLVSRGLVISKNFEGEPRYKITGRGIRKARRISEETQKIIKTRQRGAHV